MNRLPVFQQSFLPATLKLWNDLDIHVSLKESPTLGVFKFDLKVKYQKENSHSQLSLDLAVAPPLLISRV